MSFSAYSIIGKQCRIGTFLEQSIRRFKASEHEEVKERVIVLVLDYCPKYKQVFVIVVILTFLSSCTPRTPAPSEPPKADGVETEWKESKPEEQGMDSQMLSRADQFIREKYPNVYSLLVVRHGYLVYEKYYQDKNKDTYTHVFSVTKSVMSALIGIALQEKYIKSIDQKISDFLPEYFTADVAPEKKAITLKQALTMTGGIKSADDNIIEWIQSEDWFKSEIERAFAAKPGQKFIYDTGLAHLLSGVLTKAAGMTTLQFADKYLFKDLGITNRRWDTDRKGYYGGGHLLHLTPRDMAKFGQLYLRKGTWGINQLVPQDWVHASVNKQVTFDNDNGYGYLWWISGRTDPVKKKKYSSFSAQGYGGQRIDVIPDLDLVVVITANAEMLSEGAGNTGEIVIRYVIPAVK